MGKTFVVIDDNPSSHLLLIDAINKHKDDADTVVPISAEGAGGTRKRLAQHEHYQVAQTRKEIWAILNRIDGEMIILLDVDLGNVQGFKDFADPDVSRNYATYVMNPNHRSVILIHAKDIKADRIRDQIRQQCKTEEQRERIDHSVAGLDAKAENLQDTADGIVLDAIALYERRGLQRLWRHSMRDPKWFELAGGPMQHVAKDAWAWDGDERKTYQSMLAAAFAFDLPRGWIHNEAAFTVFHENLKRLCGAEYQGCGGRKNNLSVGAVFLIAMMAHASVRRDPGPFAKVDWAQVPNSATPFLGRQPEEVAKETAGRFFLFFASVFNPEKRPGLSEVSELREVRWNDSGLGFRLMFNWQVEPDHPFYRSMMRDYSPFETWSLPARASNATTSLMRLLACLNIRTNGFCHPGHIYMKDSDLYVACQ